MQPADSLVALVGSKPDRILDRVRKPAVQVSPELKSLRIEGQSTLPIRESLG